VREIRSLGSVRGVPGNRHSYRDTLQQHFSNMESAWKMQHAGLPS